MRMDPITLEVVRGRINVIVEEMQFAMIRSAYSNVVKEAADASTALFTTKGELISQVAGIPILLGVLKPAVHRLIDAFPVEKMKAGDVYMMNDPYQGGTHLPDIVVLSPIIAGGRAVALSCVITHHIDVGGKTPGSLPVDAIDIFQEGLRIPPIQLAREGVIFAHIEAVLRANSRFPEEFLGDLMAQVAACEIGGLRFVELTAAYGVKEVQTCIDELLERSERLTRLELGRIPHGTYRFIDHMDNDGVDLDRPIRIEVAVTVSDAGLHFDFTGTAPQVKGPFNATPSSVLAAAYYIVRAITSKEIPNNGGCYRALTTTLPEGSIVNPRFPAPVNARSMTFCFLIDAILGALAQALPGKIPACSFEYPVVIFGGYDAGRARAFVFHEFLTGGFGGRASLDGNDVCRSKAGNTLNSPVEATELEFPLRIVEYRLRPDSGGAGRMRGGLGCVKTFEALSDDITVSYRGERHNTPPWALEGGMPGATGRSTLTLPDESRELPAKLVFTMNTSDRLTVESPGGGGYGAPNQRDVNQIQEDFANKKISQKYIEEFHNSIQL